MSSKNYNSMLIKASGEKPIAFNRALAKITKSVKAGLFLSQILYWFDEEGNSRGKKDWIYKTIKEFEEETALSRKEQDGAIKILKKLKIIEIKVIGVPPKRHFKFNENNLEKLLSKYYSNNES